ncbi:MAG: precorrin-4 C(11)-methyltransferase [Odoribacter sp.]
MKTAIMIASDAGAQIAGLLRKELGQEVTVFSVKEREKCVQIDSITDFVARYFNDYEAFVFIGAMGICVRAIAPCIGSKYNDPAVVNIDATGHFVVSVLSGHVGGANELTGRLARMIGAEPVISTQSDTTGLWALDLLGKKYNWKLEHSGSMNHFITAFVNRCPTALLLDIKDKGTEYLERTRPEHVDVYYDFKDIPTEKYELIIAVTPWLYDTGIPIFYYHPSVLHLGVGCRKQCNPTWILAYICDELKRYRISPLSVGTVATIELKKDEPLIADLVKNLGAGLRIFTPEDLKDIEVPNPSEKVFEVTGVYGVAEAAALKSSGNVKLFLEKQKGQVTLNNDFTFALALDIEAERSGFIEIVGAGPGDPELISVRGKRLLEKADLILYAGSLVPIELTHYAKPGATVRSSASMTLEEQFVLMKEFYDRGLFIVRLHTGDPCIYGAIQEQMAFFDQYGMRYHITPGISSFLAAAAALRSQFTIPEKVQSIILTRGEGRTPMPEREKLHLLARSQSTMCIFLSASIAEEVQRELLECYPPETPVAACYHLTWKDEKIFRGELRELAAIMKENKLTLTTMIVVGEAIGNREGLSKLYSGHFKHLYRS